MQAIYKRPVTIPWREKPKPVFKKVPKYEIMRERRLREFRPANYGPYSDESREDFDRYRAYIRRLNEHDVAMERYNQRRTRSVKGRYQLDQFARRKGYRNFPTYYKRETKKIGFGSGPPTYVWPDYAGGGADLTERGKKAVAAMKVRRFLRQNKISSRSDDLNFGYKMIRRNPAMDYYYRIANPWLRKSKRPLWYQLIKRRHRLKRYKF